MSTDADRALVDTFIGHLLGERRLSRHTAAAYRRDLEQLLLTSERPLGALAPADLRRSLAAAHGRGIEPRSLARRLSAWRGFFAWAQRRGHVDQDPTAGIRAPKAPRRLPQTLSPDEASRLLDHQAESFDAACDRALFELVYSSGLRLAETIGLDLADIDLIAAQARVTGKGSKTRDVPVGSAACAALRAWLARRVEHAAADQTALFISRRGQRLGPRTVQRRLARLGQQQGLDRHVHPHMLRHAFASHLLQSSGDLRAVQELLGHASIATTQIYAHLDFQHLAKIYDQTHPRARRKPG